MRALWTAGAVFSQILAVLILAALALVGFSAGLTGAQGRLGATPEDAAPPARCLHDVERETALKIGLLSLTPSPICAPAYQVIEIRNDSPVPLGELRVALTPPLGPDRMRFEPLPGSEPGARRFVEVSTDDGASWIPIPPPEGTGTTEDPLILSGAQSPALARLGPSGGDDDSVLVRWRARLGEAFGSPFASEARLGLTASAQDACGRLVRGRERLARLSLTRPALAARLEGRNVTRGGVFGAEVAAAPGDLLEWRIGVDNYGEAHAAIARVTVALEAEEETLGAGGLAAERDAEDVTPAGGSAVDLGGVAPNGRRVTVVRGVSGARCAPLTFRAIPSWGCAAPPPGLPAALSSLSSGEASARLLRAPDPNLIAVELAMTGAAGAGRPGDEAMVRATVRNDGPPAFEPSLSITLPDGYVFDPAHPIETLSAAPGVGGAEIDAAAAGAGAEETLAAAAAGAVRLRLTGAGDAPARLNQGAGVELRFRALRVRSSALETDWLSARALFRSGCGEPGRSRLARVEVSPRQPTLSARLTPVGAPILGSANASARFRATIANDGEEAADRVLARLELGRGWSEANPAPRYCAPETEGAAAEATHRFLCRLPEAARPGGEISFDFDLSPTLEAFSDPALERDFSVLLTAEAYGDAGAAALVESPIAAARAESGAVGLALRQTLLDRSGQPWPEDRPVDLGEEVTVRLRAVWVGAGREMVTDAALYQTLPPTLAIKSVSGTQDGRALRGAVRRGQNQVIWGLEPFSGGAEATLLAAATVIGAEEAQAAAAANAVFSFRGAAHGVDAAEEGPTVAAPLTRTYRKPDLRFRFEIDDRAPEKAGEDGAPSFAAQAGDKMIGRLRLVNEGAGPGFVDRVRMIAPPGIEIASFTGDALDNDGDGRRDEADEAQSVEITEGPEGKIFTWIRLPGRGLAAGAEATGRIDPGAAAVWPIALQIRPDAPPGRALRLAFSAEFGARPFHRRSEAGRARLEGAALLKPEAAGGVLALTGARAGAGAVTEPLGALSRELTHGAEADHRAVLRLPPGRHPGARLIALLPPAFSLARVETSRIGAGLSCAGGGAPEAAPAPDWAEPGARALIWPLGDCRAAAEAPESARAALIDFAVAAADPDPTAPEAERAAWRRPEIVLWFERDGLSGEERFRQRLGASGFALRGPLLRLSELRWARPGAAAAADEVEGFDAGDRFKITARLDNLGDRPATRIRLAAASFGAVGAVDCAETRLIAGGEAAAKIETGDAPAPGGGPEGAPCGAIDLDAPLAPGATRAIEWSGRLGDSAPIGRAHRLGLKVLPFEEARRGAEIRAPILLPARGPASPVLELAVKPGAAGGSGLPRIALGEAFRLRGVFPYPEGRGEAHLALRFRLAAGEGAAEKVAAAPSLRLAAASLSKERPSASLSADPGGIMAAAPLSPVSVSPAVAAGSEQGLWRQFELPLGEIQRRNAVDGAADEHLSFEATFVLEDAAALRAGMRLEAAAVAYLDGVEAAASPARGVLAVAEPALELAALSDDVDGAAALGDEVVFSAEICNRGGAPAFAARVSAALPVGFAPAPGAPPRFVAAAASRAASAFADGPAAAAAAARQPDFGAVAVAPADGTGLRLSAEAAPGAAIAPGACVALRVPTALRQAVGAEATARFSILGYRSRPEGEPGGRLYQGVAVGETSLRLNTLTIAGPREATAAPDGRLEAAFVIAAPGARAPLSLSLEMRGVEDLGWVLSRDRDGDGRLGAGDPLWRDGERLAPGERVTVIAAAQAPRPLSARWRGAATLKAVGAAPDGAAASGTHEIALRPGFEDAAAVAALRVMAVDRDCDGDLSDETAQDAAFEPVKDAAGGECVAMRLHFSNQGSAAVEKVVIADRPPPGAELVPGSARFIETPPGLVGGEIEEPAAGAAGGEAGVRFHFVGALSPGGSGVVGYRLRLPTF